MTDHTAKAQHLLDSRVAVYGERVKNMEDVAKVFSGILGIDVRPDQVPLLMIGYKTVRASGTPDYEDNVKDIEGYALMFREILGEDMIEAVNTDEYIDEKNARAAHPCYLPGHETQPDNTCARCGEPLYGHPDYATEAEKRRQRLIEETEEDLYHLKSWDKPHIIEADGSTHPIEKAAQAHLAEACTNCRQTNCTGDCEDDFQQSQADLKESIRREVAQEQPFPTPPLPEQDFDPILAQELKTAFNETNAFVFGHARAAIVAAQAVAAYTSNVPLFSKERQQETQAMEAWLTQENQKKLFEAEHNDD